MISQVLSEYGRLVVKVGSSLLINTDDQLHRVWLQSLADDIAQLRARGHEVLVVSSGSIAIGGKVLGIDRRRARLEDLQAAAAAGQARLVHAYQEVLASHSIAVAQILLTPEDTEQRRRFLNARSTLNRLLAKAVVPIINENDTVATQEIRYGDNDRLAARVAQLVMADALVLLSDVDGLYTGDPQSDTDVRHVPVVDRVDAEILNMAGETRSETGSGGMATKVQAAHIATQSGCSTLIASGKVENPLSALEKGGRHTLFRAKSTPAVARKQWLAGRLEADGAVTVDTGAAAALARGNSLLPVGVVAVTGEFSRGDVVRVLDSNGVELARGLAEYGQQDLQRLSGCQSDEISERLGYRGRTVAIHRDNLVVFENDVS